MKTISKIAAIALVAAFVVVGASSAKAATVAELQAMIAQLTAQISALSGTTAPAASVTFTSNLTVGSTGAEVSALQNFLASKGFLTASARGYFGALTKAAVAAYQTSKGIAPAAGYFGPATRAAVNAEAAVVAPAGTTTTTTTTSALTGVGTLSVTNYTTDVEDTVDTGSSKKVLGFRAEASDGDVALTHVKISVAHSGSNSDRLNRYFGSFDVVADGKTVATVDASDFNRDSAGEYSKTVTLSNVTVKKGSSNKVAVYVVAKAIDSIDSFDANDTWKVSATNFRYSDATGAVLTETPSDVTNSGVQVRKLSASSDVKIKFSTGSANPEQQTVFVDQDTTGTLVTLLDFKVKSEGTDTTFDTAYFDVTTTGSTSNDMVSEFQLVKGSSVVETVSTIATGSPIVVKFDISDEQSIAKDATESYKLVAKLNKNTDGKFNGSTITAVASTTKFALNDKNGDVIALARYSGSASGNKQTIRGNGVALAKTSIDQVKSSTGGNSSKDYPEFTFAVKVTADGDDVYFADTATSSDFSVTKDGVAINAASSTIALSSVSGATKTSGMWRINDGETATVTYKVTVQPTGLSTGVYKAIISNFNFDNAGTTFAKDAAFTPVDTFTSGSVTIVQ